MDDVTYDFDKLQGVLPTAPAPWLSERHEGLVRERGLHMIAGAPGSGKTSLMVALAAWAAVSTGLPILYVCRDADDSPAARFAVNDGDSGVTLGTRFCTFPDDVLPAVNEDWPEWARELSRHPVCDSLGAALIEPAIDLMPDTGLATGGRILRGFRPLAERMPVVLGHHDSQDSTLSGQDKVSGSRQWTASCQLVHLIAARGRMTTVKANGLGQSLEGQESRWSMEDDGKIVNLTRTSPEQAVRDAISEDRAADELIATAVSNAYRLQGIGELAELKKLSRWQRKRHGPFDDVLKDAGLTRINGSSPAMVKELGRTEHATG